MNVNLHVEEIALHGIPLRRADLPLLERAIRAQLKSHFRQLADPDVAAVLPADRGRIDISQTMSPDEFGRDIARSLYPVASRQADKVT